MGKHRLYLVTTDIEKPAPEQVVQLQPMYSQRIRDAKPGEFATGGLDLEAAISRLDHLKQDNYPCISLQKDGMLSFHASESHCVSGYELSLEEVKERIDRAYEFLRSHIMMEPAYVRELAEKAGLDKGHTDVIFNLQSNGSHFNVLLTRLVDDFEVNPLRLMKDAD